jgi:hypothetical protein
MTPERLYQFWILFGGQVMLGVALPFVGLNVVTVLATNWFSESERTIGGTIAMLANILGPAVAFGVCPAIVKSGPDIQTLLLAEAIAVTVVCSSFSCFRLDFWNSYSYKPDDFACL